MLLQPSICVLCAATCEDQAHLFLFCPYASVCWDLFFHMFNLAWVKDKSVSSSIFQLLFDPFFSPKASLLWVNGLKALISELWFERNQRTFEGKSRSAFECYSIAKFKASQWCALSNLFANYSPSMICSNWEAFLCNV